MKDSDKLKQLIDVRYSEALETYVRDDGRLMASAKDWKSVVATVASELTCLQPDAILAIGTRGWAFGAALAMHIDVALIQTHKQMKVPLPVLEVSYPLEYGHDIMRMRPELA